MNATDVVGYMFQADIYCPDCIGGVLTSTPEYENFALAGGVVMTAEEDLDEVALAFGIDRHDESSYDSDVFPKVLLADPSVNRYCGACDGPFIELESVPDFPYDRA